MVEALQALYDLAKKEHREADALSLLRQLAALDQHDRKVYGKLLDALVSAGQWAEARKIGENAMFVDVENPAIHALYARALAAGNNHAQAIFELSTALLANPQPKDAAAIHGLLAKEHAATANPAKARAERDEALRLDPDERVAKGLRLP